MSLPKQLIDFKKLSHLWRKGCFERTRLHTTEESISFIDEVLKAPDCVIYQIEDANDIYEDLEQIVSGNSDSEELKQEIAKHLFLPSSNTVFCSSLEMSDQGTAPTLFAFKGYETGFEGVQMRVCGESHTFNGSGHQLFDFSDFEILEGGISFGDNEITEFYEKALEKFGNGEALKIQESEEALSWIRAKSLENRENYDKFQTAILRGVLLPILFSINCPSSGRSIMTRKVFPSSKSKKLGLGKFKGYTIVRKPTEPKHGEIRRSACGRKSQHWCRSHLRFTHGKFVQVKGHWRGDPDLGRTIAIHKEK